jgi:hypothetical protein
VQYLHDEALRDRVDELQRVAVVAEIVALEHERTVANDQEAADVAALAGQDGLIEAGEPGGVYALFRRRGDGPVAVVGVGVRGRGR